MPSGTATDAGAIEDGSKVMQRQPTTWNKSFFDYAFQAGIGRALKAHYDHQLEEDHQSGEQLLAQRLAILLNKIDELEGDEPEGRERPPRTE